MPSIHKLTCIFLLLWAGEVMSMPVIDRRPTNVTVREGQEALFECRILDLGGGEVIWMRPSSGTVISNNMQVSPGATPTAGQYIIEANPRRGDYNLKITQVQRGDVGEYRCVLSTGRMLQSASAHLKVLVPPLEGYPSCSLQQSRPNTKLAVGDEVRLVCLSNGGEPRADLTWYKNGVLLSDGLVKKGINNLERVLSLSDMDAVYECRAESPAITQPRNCTKSITLASPMVIVQPYNQKAEVGDTVTFLCNRQDKPNEDRFQWYFRGERITSTSSRRFIINDYNRALTIKNITAQDSGAFIKCEVSGLPEPYTGRAYLMVSIMTGEVLGTLPPPRLVTESPTGHDSPSMGRRGDHDVSSPRMSVSGDETQSQDKTAMFVILGAGGGLFIVISAIVINYVVIRRKKNKKDHPKSKSNMKPIASGLSLMTTKDSERSLSSSDSVVTTKTTVTTMAGPCSKKDASSKSIKKEGCQYTELDSNGLRSSEYQGLNAPPMTIYAEPIISPTRLVPRPQHQDGFHDYALPDILPELESPHEEYVEPDPPPKDKNGCQKQQETKTKVAPKLEEKVLSQQNPDGVYIEIIA